MTREEVVKGEGKEGKERDEDEGNVEKRKESLEGTKSEI